MDISIKPDYFQIKQTPAALPDVSFHTALSSELVLHQVGVVRGGDEVMAQRLAHVLVDAPPLWVEDGALS